MIYYHTFLPLNFLEVADLERLEWFGIQNLPTPVTRPKGSHLAGAKLDENNVGGLFGNTLLEDLFQRFSANLI